MGAASVVRFFMPWRRKRKKMARAARTQKIGMPMPRPALAPVDRPWELLEVGEVVAWLVEDVVDEEVWLELVEVLVVRAGKTLRSELW